MINPVVLAFGANLPGPWGDIGCTFAHARTSLASAGVDIIAQSSVWRTRPAGTVRQPAYLNQVVTASTALPPRRLLMVLKQLERRFGRRLTARNGPRPLDIDLIDYGGQIVNWPATHPRPKLVLPHPLMAGRPFVLVPLAEIAPSWRHPVIGLTARELLLRAGGRARFMLRRDISRVDSAPIPCD